MNKLTTAVLGLAVAVLPVLAASPAFAADEQDCNRAQREVARVELKLAAAVTSEREAEQKLVKEAKAALKLLQEDDVANGEQRDLIEAARSLVNLRVDELNTDSKRLVNLRADLTAAISDRDEKCAEDPEPTPTTTPATPTTPANEDVDCDEVTDARAQEILDADRNDPHNLDDDNDGVACEEEEVLVADNDSVVVAPSGGVNTGGWRR